MSTRGLVLETVASSKPGRIAVKKDAICTVLEEHQDGFYKISTCGQSGWINIDKITVSTSFLPTANYEATNGDVSTSKREILRQ